MLKAMFFWKALVIGAVLACASCSQSSAHAARTDDLASAECTAYLAAYRSCIAPMATPDVADARVQALRASLERRAAGDASLRGVCAAEQNHLRNACH